MSFTPWPFNTRGKRLGSLSRSGRLGKKINLLSQQGIEPRFCSFPAHSLEAQSYIRPRNLIPQVS
jgi:hypothetical protein